MRRVLLLTAAIALHASTAGAAVVQLRPVTPGGPLAQLQVIALPGETNVLALTAAGDGSVVVADAAAPLHAGAGCAGGGATVRCTPAAGLVVVVTGGAGSRRVSLEQLAGYERGELAGGAGADALLGGAADDDLTGGAGDDLLSGGPGADRISPGPGADFVRGGHRDRSGRLRRAGRADDDHARRPAGRRRARRGRRHRRGRRGRAGRPRAGPHRRVARGGRASTAPRAPTTSTAAPATTCSSTRATRTRGG